MTHQILWQWRCRQGVGFPLSSTPLWWRTLLQFQTLSTPWLCSSTLGEGQGGHYMERFSPSFRPSMVSSSKRRMIPEWAFEENLVLWEKEGIKKGRGGKLCVCKKGKVVRQRLLHVTHVTKKLSPTRILQTTWPRSCDPPGGFEFCNYQTSPSKHLWFAIQIFVQVPNWNLNERN